MLSTRLTIFILVEQKDAANTWMKANVDRQGGEFTFTAPLTEDGENITHYWASGLWSDSQIAALQEQFGANAYKGSLQAALAKAGLSVFLVSI